MLCLSTGVGCLRIGRLMLSSGPLAAHKGRYLPDNSVIGISGNRTLYVFHSSREGFTSDHFLCNLQLTPVLKITWKGLPVRFSLPCLALIQCPGAH